MDKLRIIQYQSDAADSCKTRGININDHFRDFTKMVDLGSEAKCYLALCQWQNVGFPAVKSRSDDTLLTVDAICGQNDVRRSAKSRRDDILLTVGFNLRKLNGHLRSKSRRDDILSATGTKNMSSLRDLADSSFSSFRRLKPTVINVSSLRDFAANRQVRKYTFDPTLERRVASNKKSIEKTTQKLPKEEKTK